MSRRGGYQDGRPRQYDILVVGPRAVTKGLTMHDCIDAMHEMYDQGRKELNNQPARILTRVDLQSLILTMPSYSARLRRFAVKLVTEFKRNPKSFGIPAQGGVTALLDGKNSQVLALADSAALTAVRTGAVSGLATKLLSRKNSRKVGILGSGQQARTQLEAVCEVRRIEEVVVYSPHPAHSKLFSKDMGRITGAVVKPCSRPGLATEGADILIAATNSSVPVIGRDQVPPGCHINSIGTLPEREELPPEVISMSSVYVDTVEGVLREAGDVIRAIRRGLFSRERIIADLGGVIRNPGLGRKRNDEVTLFKSVGFGLQDLYSFSRLYDAIVRDPQKYLPDAWTVTIPGASP